MHRVKPPFFTLLAVFLLAPTMTSAGEFNAVMDIGDPMPAFENLPTTDGGTLSSADLQASVVVLVSLANHCPWVKGMDAGLVALVDQFEGQDVRVVGFAVNHREDDRLPAMKDHAARVGYNFTYMFDESQEIGRRLGATRTPEYFVFNAERKLVYMGLLTNSPARVTRKGDISFINGDPVDFYVADAISATLKGEPVDPAETRAHGCTVKYE
ncbi:MAG: redoxin family protein [Lysobacterales bacterium]|jgi:peroxiredoxin